MYLFLENTMSKFFLQHFSVMIAILLLSVSCHSNGKGIKSVHTDSTIVKGDSIPLYCFTDEDFLKTREKMSDLAINPVEDENGTFEDKNFNIAVYTAALKRMEHYTCVRDGQIHWSSRSGSEINMADDLYDYIIALYKEQNRLIKEGRYKIVKHEDGTYELEVINKNSNPN